MLDIQILDGEEGLKYTFDYSSSRYEEGTMIAFKELFKRVVATIINNTNTDGCSFKQLKEYVCGKKSLLEKLKGV